MRSFCLPFFDGELESGSIEECLYYELQERRLESRGFEHKTIRGGHTDFPWIIKTPSGRILTHDALKNFYNETKLEFGNREHIEILKALEYLEALQYLYDDVNENIF